MSISVNQRLKILRALRELRVEKNLVNPVILSKKFVLICVYPWFRFFSHLHFATWRLCGKQSRLKSSSNLFVLKFLLLVN